MEPAPEIQYDLCLTIWPVAGVSGATEQIQLFPQPFTKHLIGGGLGRRGRLTRKSPGLQGNSEKFQPGWWWGPGLRFFLRAVLCGTVLLPTLRSVSGWGPLGGGGVAWFGWPRGVITGLAHHQPHLSRRLFSRDFEPSTSCPPQRRNGTWVLRQGSPASRISYRVIGGGADAITIKCTRNVMCFNHPKITLPTPATEQLPSRTPVLAKKAGGHCPER